MEFCVFVSINFLPKIQSWNLESNPHSSIPSKIDSKAIYVRPLCSTFLRALSDFANITIWSSIQEPTIQQICEYLFRGSQLLFLGRIVVIEYI